MLRRALERVKPDLVQAWGTERGAALVASRLKYPHLVTMQGLLEWYLEHADLGRYVRLEAKLEQLSLRRSSFVTAESKFAMNWLGSHYPNLKLRQVEHAPNWLFHQLKRTPLTKPLQFLFVGTLGPLKGADLLMQALDRLKGELDFHLTIVGNHGQHYMKQLSAISSKALWERVSILSDLTQEQVAEQMARATILLFPTRADNSPNAVKEAVVCGLPVVGSGVGGILDYVLPGLNGLTFRGGELEGFIGAIRTAVAHPLFGQGKVDQETLAQMRSYLSPARMAEGFLSAYREVSESALLESEANIDAGRALG
jgi:glycosyltransferase involved in cell wall biosynthesis